MDDGLKKILIAIVVIVLLVPVAVKLLPKPMTWDRMQNGFKNAGLTVEQFEVVPASMESVEQASATINAMMVDIYRYDDEGKIVRNLEYQKPDPGAAIVESWGLAQSLGAAVTKKIPTRSARRGMYLIVATGEDEASLDRIVQAFKAL